jgi:hypothetical protein
MMFACYPFPAGPGTCGEQNVVGYPACAMDRLPLAADLFLSELNAPGQPLWMIVQAHKSIQYKEARWEAVAAFIHGATGVLWAGWPWEHALGNGWLSWPDVSRCIRDFESLHPFLVGKDVSGAQTSTEDVEVRVKRSTGPHVAAFAISRNEFSGDASIFLPDLPNGGNVLVTVAHEGRQVQAVDGWITDTFDGYQAHVYRYVGSRYADPRLAADVEGVAGSVPFSVRTHPNPTRGATTVSFELDRPSSVLFQVYDTAGRRVALAGHGSFDSGAGSVTWDGRDLEGKRVAPGVYFIRGRTTGGDEATARVLIQR